MRISFTSLACPGASVEAIADAARRYGYDGIEWRLADGALLGPSTPDAIWDRIASCGMAAACLDTSCVFVRADESDRRQAIDDAVAMAQRARQIDAASIRVFGGVLPDGVERADAVRMTAPALEEAASRCRDAGVRLFVETHDAWPRAADVAELVAGTTAGILWDVLHTWRAGETPATSFEVCTGSLDVVHLKDGDAASLTLLGEGEVPVGDVVGRADDVGWLSFEWEKLWHPEIAEPEVALPHAIDVIRRLAA